MAGGDSRAFNINVGVLGHVDSGKTSLVAGLSDILSVAALDKHPQSKLRGITIDIGVSAFTVPCPENLQRQLNTDKLQFTLIDCPGHASLIKTVLLGAQIVDVMILVVDVTKGIQAQTAECIILGELLSAGMVVALNKTDLLPKDGRRKKLRHAGRAILSELNFTRFAGSSVVPVCARADALEGLEALKDALIDTFVLVPRRQELPLLMMVDHCFAVKGHGTVFTGTVLQGQLRVGETVEVPELKEQRKVRSMQQFKRPCNHVVAGERAGVCLAKVPPDRLERTLLAAPGLMRTFSSCVCRVQRCRFFTGDISSRRKVYITVGHQTRSARVQFFGLPDGCGCTQQQLAEAMLRVTGRLTRAAATNTVFEEDREYLLQESLFGLNGRPTCADAAPDLAADSAADATDGTARAELHFGKEWALLQLDQPALGLEGQMIISTKLELDVEHCDSAQCRIAFYGALVKIFERDQEFRRLRLFKVKRREGIVDRVTNSGDVIIKDMFKKETALEQFLNQKLLSGSGVPGTILAGFGGSGKVRAAFERPLQPCDRRVTLYMKKFLHEQQP